MKSFLKYLLATIVGVFLASLVMFFIFLGIISALISIQEKPVEIKDNSILMLKLDKPVSDRKPSIPFFSTKAIGLNEVLSNIQKAKEDEKIKGIYLEPSFIPAGLATVEEIRNAVLDFKESGKFVICHSDFYTQPSYYLATAADKIYMNPEGYFPLIGFRAQLMFFKGTLNKLGIKAEIIRHGKFKSAVEPFMYDKMSDENREQLKTIIGSIWDHTVSEISAQRGITKEKINSLADNLSVWDAESTVKNDLVDSLIYKDHVLDKLKELTGIEKSKKLNFVSLAKYNKVPGARKHKGLAKSKVAVIYASGNIELGDKGEGQISSERISEAIRKARIDTTIKAIVFRVNSGGGDALASEVIWRELNLAREAKPVIASFGDVAASGGYYIAVSADTIVASPATITGSIGVFGVMLNLKDFLNNKLGITMDVEKTNKYSDFMSGYRSITATEKEVMQNFVDKIYNTFITHVSEGRNMDYNEVDKIGEGRVWSGINAREIGLVDVYGGLSAAIDIAVEKAKLEKYRIVELPKLEDPLEQIMKELMGEVRLSYLKKELGNTYKYYHFLQEALNLNGIQARIPYEIEIY
jgi:protease-4